MLPSFTRVFGSAVGPPATCPAATGGFTAPKPTPYNTMWSPARAGRNTAPDASPGGPTNVELSGNSAAGYCLPPERNADGARRAGALAATATAVEALLPL